MKMSEENKPSAVDDAADIMSQYEKPAYEDPLTDEEKKELEYKKKLEELRKRDPFVYR